MSYVLYHKCALINIFYTNTILGIAGALVSHPADLILTLTSASSREEGETKDWKMIVNELLESDGGVVNLFTGFRK